MVSRLSALRGGRLGGGSPCQVSQLCVLRELFFTAPIQSLKDTARFHAAETCLAGILEGFSAVEIFV